MNDPLPDLEDLPFDPRTLTHLLSGSDEKAVEYILKHKQCLRKFIDGMLKFSEACASPENAARYVLLMQSVLNDRESRTALLQKKVNRQYRAKNKKDETPCGPLGLLKSRWQKNGNPRT